jgi:hypothetical protein
MNKQAIVNLIISDDDEKIIAKTLITWFINNPLLLDLTYLSDQNIFHFLIRINKFYVVKELLNNKDWLPKATTNDAKGRTVLHYAVKNKETGAHVLELLMEHFPELLNTADASGNTPLHTAILAKKAWSARMLVKSPQVNRELLNLNGKSPLSLAGNNKELKQALVSIEFSTIKELDLRHRTDSFREELKAVFPSLSSRSDDFSSSNSFDALPSSLILAKAEISEHDAVSIEEKEDTYKSQTISTDQFTSLLKELVVKYKKDSNSLEYLNLQKQFNELCTKDLLTSTIDLTQEDVCTRETWMIISNTLNFLYPNLHKQYSRIQQQINSSLKIFVYLLVNHQVFADVQSKAALDTNNDKYQENDILLKKLWLLTAGQEVPDAAPEFNFSTLSYRTLGLLSSYSIIDILIGLRRIYPDCDTAQKSIANFVVLQLLFYHATEKIQLNPLLAMHFRFIYKLNVKTNSGLGKLGEQINQYLQKAHELISIMSTQPLFHNFYLLKQQINHPELINANDSFDNLVNQALALPQKERAMYVERAANALRTLAMQYYQDLSLSEFNDGNWLKIGRKQSAPNITEITENFNKLNAYFIEKILSQPRTNVQNALLFLLELSQSVCPLEGERYPDLNHLMVLTSVINSIPILRLSTVFDALSEKDQNIIKQINQVVSHQKNFNFMRKIYSTYRTTLPFLGNILTDITFANEANKDKLSEKKLIIDIRAEEVVGTILKMLMEIKILINFELIIPHTNLRLFLKDYSPPDEKYFDQASLRLQPKKNDVVNLDSTIDDLNAFLDNLEKHFFSENILPTVIIDNEELPPSQIANGLLKMVAKKIKKKEDLPMSFLKNFETVLHRVIEINNVYYYPQGLASKLNYMFYVMKLADFKQQITEMKKPSINAKEQSLSIFTLSEEKPKSEKESKDLRKTNSLNRIKLFSSNKQIITRPGVGKVSLASAKSNTPPAS